MVLIFRKNKTIADESAPTEQKKPASSGLFLSTGFTGDQSSPNPNPSSANKLLNSTKISAIRLVAARM
jgi:hypothetical protein